MQKTGLAKKPIGAAASSSRSKAAAPSEAMPALFATKKKPENVPDDIADIIVEIEATAQKEYEGKLQQVKNSTAVKVRQLEAAFQTKREALDAEMAVRNEQVERLTEQLGVITQENQFKDETIRALQAKIVALLAQVDEEKQKKNADQPLVK